MSIVVDETLVHLIIHINYILKNVNYFIRNKQLISTEFDQM